MRSRIVALGNYRRVLALPGVGTLLVIMLVARIPVAATTMVLTLHVVLTMHHGYGEAGLVGAAGTIGIAVGAPLMGTIVDRLGVRPMLVLTTIGYGAYWLTAWLLPYTALLVLSFVGGLLALPVMSIGRQAVAALVPDEHRRAAYSLDAVSVEMSYMVGPALGVLIATKVSTTAAVLTVGCLLVASGLVLFAVNPPVRAGHEDVEPGTPRPRRGEWLTRPLMATMVLGAGTVFALAGTEVAMVAALRGVGQVGLAGVVTIAMCVASLVGGVVYGALHRTPGPAVLLGLLGVLLVPAGLAGGQWWVLCALLAPTNLMCAPTLAGITGAVSRMAPPVVRGEAMGLQSSTLTLGAAFGSPVIGVAVDGFGAGWGFALSGVAAVIVAVVAWPLTRGAGLPAAERATAGVS